MDSSRDLYQVLQIKNCLIHLKPRGEVIPEWKMQSKRQTLGTGHANVLTLSIFNAGLSFSCTFWVSNQHTVHKCRRYFSSFWRVFLALFHALHPTFASSIRYEKTPFYNHDVLYEAQSTDCKKVTCHQDNNVLNAYVIIKVKNRSRSIRIDRSTCMPAGKAPPILVF